MHVSTESLSVFGTLVITEMLFILSRLQKLSNQSINVSQVQSRTREEKLMFQYTTPPMEVGVLPMQRMCRGYIPGGDQTEECIVLREESHLYRSVEQEKHNRC